MASVTKLFIATAVLQLVERERLRLDAPIGEYLPTTLTAGLHRHRGSDHGERLTVEHLLRHVSGLPDWLEDRPKGGQPLIAELFAGGDRTFAIEDVIAGERALALPLTMASVRDLYGTGGDLVSFLRALTSGATFGDPATGRLMQHRWRRFGMFLDPAALSQPRWPIQYGMGMMRLELPWFLDPRRRVPPFVGHTGSTGTWAFFVPALDLYLAGTVDQATAAPLPFSFVPRLLRQVTA